MRWLSDFLIYLRTWKVLKVGASWCKKRHREVLVLVGERERKRGVSPVNRVNSHSLYIVLSWGGVLVEWITLRGKDSWVQVLLKLCCTLSSWFKIDAFMVWAMLGVQWCLTIHRVLHCCWVQTGGSLSSATPAGMPGTTASQRNWSVHNVFFLTLAYLDSQYKLWDGNQTIGPFFAPKRLWQQENIFIPYVAS